MLPPSDRANLYGPYCSHHRAVYTDGVQDGYPFVANGRDNGALYFGQFGKLRLEAGAYDGTSATGKNSVIAAGRAQYDFSHERPRVSTSSKKDASSPAATFPNRRTRSSAGI